MDSQNERPWHIGWLMCHGFSHEKENEWAKEDVFSFKLRVHRTSKGRFFASLQSEEGWMIEDAIFWNTPEEAVESVLKKMNLLKEEISLQKERISKFDFI